MDLTKYNLQKYNLGKSVFEWLDKQDKNKAILELGAGISTRVLSDMGFTVYSIEAHKEYIEALDNVTSYHVPLAKENNVQWYDTKILQEILENLNYDIVIVDGPRGSEGRSNMVYYTQLFDLSATFIVDDCEREADNSIFESIKQRKETLYKTSVEVIKDNYNGHTKITKILTL